MGISIFPKLKLAPEAKLRRKSMSRIDILTEAAEADCAPGMLSNYEKSVKLVSKALSTDSIFLSYILSL